MTADKKHLLIMEFISRQLTDMFCNFSVLPEPVNATPATPPNPIQKSAMISEIWDHPATIEVNGFKFKSLSNWSFNTTIGCSHGCRFCYVPSTATNKQAPALKILGVQDPDAEWGEYVFVRECHRPVDAGRKDRR